MSEDKLLKFCFMTTTFIIGMIIILRERNKKDIDKETNRGQGG